jgi:hypothetical protein
LGEREAAQKASYGGEKKQGGGKRKNENRMRLKEERSREDEKDERGRRRPVGCETSDRLPMRGTVRLKLQASPSALAEQHIHNVWHICVLFRKAKK